MQRFTKARELDGIDEHPRIIYNPFRKLKRQSKRTNTEQDLASPSPSFLPPQLSPKPITREDTPFVVGQLFSLVNAQAETVRSDDVLGNDDVPARSSLPGPPAETRHSGPVDEEKVSLDLSDAPNQLTNRWFQMPMLKLYGHFVRKTPAKPENFSVIQITGAAREVSRKRRVIVVEFGNTDDMTEGSIDGPPTVNTTYNRAVTAENVRQSFNDPIYSEMAVAGYPTDRKGHQSTQYSSALGQPLKESLHKFNAQKGSANMRVFYVQDDRQAFLCLGHAYHMTFSGHKTNYRAWAIGPSNAPEPEKTQWQWLDFLAVHLNPLQTMFWRPDRTGDVIRTAFGMDYPVIHLAEEFADFMEESLEEKQQHKNREIVQVPESSQQRVSVYIQLKKQNASARPSSGPSLGLNENTTIILDSMRTKVTRDELLDGALSLKRLMYDADIEDPLLGNPVLIATIRLVLDAVAGKWSDYILAMQNYIVSVEEVIYSQPANDRYSPLLWDFSKKLLQAERLIKLQLHLVENLQNDLMDITGPKTMEPDWLRQNTKEFSRLSSEIEESLRKPVAQMVDLMYKSIGIRDARQSLELNTSLWRLSWITFIFLPLTLLASLFGMNVEELRSEPSIKWYFTAAVPLMILVMISYLSARKLMRKEVEINYHMHQPAPPLHQP